MDGLSVQKAALQKLDLIGSSCIQSSSLESKPTKKIRCAFPYTKMLRDECVVQHGEDAYGKWIAVHLKCLRAEGFNSDIMEMFEFINRNLRTSRVFVILH
ncbi:hypothetical protein SAY86_016015 [Trapa natans]|uniref:Uncharacterized protein n=1 Tax=Trapa natans TaxID=22666 RepID=A0AAN7LFA8_TRANT|nr:hypothetical protein SAY86_016015 [Trapa natans]